MARLVAKPAVTFQTNTELAVEVTDLAAAEAFYGGVMGFKVVERNPAFIAFDSGALWLYVKQQAQPGPPVPSMDVSNVTAAKRQLIAAGCEIVRESTEDRALYFKDPFGVVWDVIERKA